MNRRVNLLVIDSYYVSPVGLEAYCLSEYSVQNNSVICIYKKILVKILVI